MDEWLKLAALFAGAYLFGSIPTAYLVGRWFKRIDIRKYGSGNVGGSNVYHSVARWAILPVGLFDIFKGALPAWLALHALDMGYGAAVFASICAMIGHTFSVFLGFTGGRGLSTVVGGLAVVFPEGMALLIVVLAISWRLDYTGLAAIGLLLIPPVALLLDQPQPVALGGVGMIVVTAVKRVHANGAPLPEGHERRSVLWRRLWLDRDIASHEEWLARKPE